MYSACVRAARLAASSSACACGFTVRVGLAWLGLAWPPSVQWLLGVWCSAWLVACVLQLRVQAEDSLLTVSRPDRFCGGLFVFLCWLLLDPENQSAWTRCSSQSCCMSRTRQISPPMYFLRVLRECALCVCFAALLTDDRPPQKLQTTDTKREGGWEVWLRWVNTTTTPTLATRYGIGTTQAATGQPLIQLRTKNQFLGSTAVSSFCDPISGVRQRCPRVGPRHEAMPFHGRPTPLSSSPTHKRPWPRLTALTGQQLKTAPWFSAFPHPPSVQGDKLYCRRSVPTLSEHRPAPESWPSMSVVSIAHLAMHGS